MQEIEHPVGDVIYFHPLPSNDSPASAGRTASDFEPRYGARVTEYLQEHFKRIDLVIVSSMARWATHFLRAALGIIYVWFGVLKILGLSPVAQLVGKMSFRVPKDIFVRIVGIWEVTVGVALLFRFALRLTLALFFLQLTGTFLVFVFHPEEAYRERNPFLLTGTGEFIVKNVVLFAAGAVIYSTVRSKVRKVTSPRPASGRLL